MAAPLDVAWEEEAAAVGETLITDVLGSLVGDGETTAVAVAEVEVASDVDVESAVEVAATGVPMVEVSLSLMRLTGPGPSSLEPSSLSGMMINGSASASGPVPLPNCSSYRWKRCLSATLDASKGRGARLACNQERERRA